MDFTFATPAAVRFGSGAVSHLATDVAGLGSRVFLVTGGRPERTADVVRDLPVVGSYALDAEPGFDDASAAVAAARDSGAEVIVGVGGGAVIDLAKAVAILAVAEGEALDYAEVIGAGRQLPSTSLPFIAVPTTAGTGSEVTSNAVLASAEHGVKVSLRSPSMLARVAIVDPELTLTCPPLVTAQSGMDALTQCLEPLTSRFANPLVDALATAGLRHAADGLVRAVEQGDDLGARAAMSFCSLMGGLSLSNAKLGTVHGLAGVLGGATGAAHGAICAALLEPVTAANLRALHEREPDNAALDAYADAADALTGERDTHELLRWLHRLHERLRFPGLGALGLTDDQREHVVDASMKASSMKGNPIVLTRDELLGILDAAA